MTVNLSKGQRIDLRKADGRALGRVRMGLGWDAMTVTRKTFFGGTKTYTKAIDLDASALMVSAGRVVDAVYFGQLRSKDRSIQHTGDNTTGLGEGDDESVIVELPSVDAAIDAIFFVVNSYSGESFSEIENATVRVVDSQSGDSELARYSLTGTGPHTAMIMAKVTRESSGWVFTAIGQAAQGTRLNELVDLVNSGRW